MNQQTALIVGNGMDSAHLSNFLLDKDYKVIIGTRRSGSSDNWRLKELGILQHPNLKIEAMDLTEFNNVKDIVEKYKFDEIFNLGAQSFVQSSFGNPYTTNMANYMGHINLLEVVRHYSPKSKIYFAASSEMYGKVQEIPQKETTPFYPRSPYGVSKLASYWMGVNYRESHNMFICNGILFNHESSLRGEEFVTRKITKKVAEIKYCLENNLSFTPLVLGNMDAKRDWSYAGDMVEGMWLMLQYNKPDDYVLCNGDCYMVREFVDHAFYYAGIPIAWKGKGIDEKVLLEGSDKVLVEVSPEFFRPCEVDLLKGDCTKAKEILNWKPKYSFSMLVESMVKADIERTKSKKIIIRDDCE